MTQVIEPERITHDEKGRFVPGHPFMGNNELARKQLAKRSWIIDSTTKEEAMEVLEAMRQQALKGDKGAAQAAAIYLHYAIGAPEKMMTKDDAVKQFDVINLNRPSSELTAEQRRARIAYLMSQRETETK